MTTTTLNSKTTVVQGQRGVYKQFIPEFTKQIHDLYMNRKDPARCFYLACKRYANKEVSLCPEDLKDMEIYCHKCFDPVDQDEKEQKFDKVELDKKIEPEKEKEIKIEPEQPEPVKVKKNAEVEFVTFKPANIPDTPLFRDFIKNCYHYFGAHVWNTFMPKVTESTNKVLNVCMSTAFTLLKPVINKIPETILNYPIFETAEYVELQADNLKTTEGIIRPVVEIKEVITENQEEKEDDMENRIMQFDFQEFPNVNPAFVYVSNLLLRKRSRCGFKDGNVLFDRIMSEMVESYESIGVGEVKTVLFDGPTFDDNYMRLAATLLALYRQFRMTMNYKYTPSERSYWFIQSVKDIVIGKLMAREKNSVNAETLDNMAICIVIKFLAVNKLAAPVMCPTITVTNEDFDEVNDLIWAALRKTKNDGLGLFFGVLHRAFLYYYAIRFHFQFPVSVTFSGEAFSSFLLLH